jgi:hypothetical protein
VTETDDWDGDHRVYRLSDEMVRELESRMSSFVSEARKPPLARKMSHPRLTYLLQTLKRAMPGILKKADTIFRLRIAFGLLSRLYLETRGYVDYHTKHQPLHRSGAKQDIKHGLVGVLTEEKKVCKKFLEMGIPVWYVRRRSQVSWDMRTFVERTNPRIYQSRPFWPLDCFRDDGVLREESVVHEGRMDMAEFVGVVNDWMKEKLERLFE